MKNKNYIIFDDFRNVFRHDKHLYVERQIICLQFYSIYIRILDRYITKCISYSFYFSLFNFAERIVQISQENKLISCCIRKSLNYYIWLLMGHHHRRRTCSFFNGQVFDVIQSL